VIFTYTNRYTRLKILGGEGDSLPFTLSLRAPLYIIFYRHVCCCQFSVDEITIYNIHIYTTATCSATTAPCVRGVRKPSAMDFYKVRKNQQNTNTHHHTLFRLSGLCVCKRGKARV